MNINENKEFEAINQKVKERTETVEEIRQSAANAYHDVKARRSARAILSIVITMCLLGLFLTGFWALQMIGWINEDFEIVLMCASGAVAMFKIGGFWQAFKQ